jgi:hypothetical protein
LDTTGEIKEETKNISKRSHSIQNDENAVNEVHASRLSNIKSAKTLKTNEEITEVRLIYYKLSK